jgi:predicted small lipoprotein YifL
MPGEGRDASWVPRALALLLCAGALAACGKKGPPLPPLYKVPVPPADLTAERRGDEVSVQFTVPTVNTDNTKPANVDRVDVYALTGPSTVTDQVLLKRGTLVGSVDVKAPSDPNDTVDEDEPEGEAAVPEGTGVDQGTVARLDDYLTPEATAQADTSLSRRRPRQKPADAGEGPLLGPAIDVPSRVYAVVGVNPKGRKGPVSRRVVVPLLPPPPAPASPEIIYDEKAVHLTWAVAEGDAGAVLASHPLGVRAPTVAYYVYQLPAQRETGEAPAGKRAARAAAGGAAAAGKPEGQTGKTSTQVAAAPGVPLRLTTAPLAEPRYDDARMDWEHERCYGIRALESFGDLKIESEMTEPACVTPIDTFPPAAPRGLRAVGTEGAISLIWDANAEADLGGYLVMRGESPESMKPVTRSAVQDTTFRDTVPAGVRFFYAIVAVDKAGNRSKASEAVEETAK